MVTLLISVGIGAFTAVAAPVVVYTNLDFYYAFIQAICIENTRVKQFLLIARYPLSLHTAFLLVLVLRTLPVLGIQAGIGESFLLKFLTKEYPSWTHINLYKEIVIVITETTKLIQICTAHMFPGTFLLMMIGALVSVISFKNQDVILGTSALIMTLMVYFILSMAFYCGISIYNNSCLILRKWRLETDWGKRKGESLVIRAKVVKSLRPVALPAANIGIIDTEIKITFMAQFLIYFMNALITLKHS